MYLLKYSLVLWQLVSLSQGHLKFTNLKCVELDKTYATIPICKLRIVQRGVVAMDLHAKIHKGPVDNVSVNVALLKKANGYRPFLYNVSANFCQLMRNGKKYPFLNVFVKILGKDSNINHTCPYEKDIIVNGLVLKEEMFRLLPLPQGDYLLDIKIAVHNVWLAIIKAYFQMTDN